MKSLLFFLSYLLAAIALQLFFPWWSVVLLSFAFGYLANPLFHLRATALLAAFGVGLEWAAFSFSLDRKTQGKISLVVSEIFHLPTWSLYPVSGLLVALPSALAFVVGYRFKNMLNSWDRQRNSKLF